MAGRRKNSVPGGAGSHLNDVLIALTARSIGGTVVTANAADFAAIQQVEPFAFELP